MTLAAVVAAGCDHGSALLVENQADSDFIIRTTGRNDSGYAGF
jgi:hypothetical protein